MATLKDMLAGTHPPFTSHYNPPAITRELMGAPMPCENGQPASVGTPPAQRLFNLNIKTPFAFLWNRPKNVLQG